MMACEDLITPTTLPWLILIGVFVAKFGVNRPKKNSEHKHLGAYTLINVIFLSPNLG